MASNDNCCIAILVNPLSGKGKAIRIGKWLAAQLSAINISHQLFSVQWPIDFESFTEIWIIGGDGTINYFVNHYPGIRLPLALFKGGTGNDFAWKLYGDISLQEQFDLVLKARSRPVDAGVCNSKLYLNSLGIGFDGAVLRSMHAIRRVGGHLGYLWVVVRKIFSYREPVFKINAGKTNYEEKFLLVIINNSSRTGGGFMVTPVASVHDGKLDLVLCKPLSLVRRLRYLPVIEKGKHLQLPFIYFSQPGNVYIECKEEMFAQLDGELISATTFEVGVLPGQFIFKY